jgi:hypothetical protein
MTEREHKNLNFYVEESDRRKLEAICERLGLSRSEISRRALRLGLDRLQRATLPGSVHPEKEAHAE